MFAGLQKWCSKEKSVISVAGKNNHQIETVFSQSIPASSILKNPRFNPWGESGHSDTINWIRNWKSSDSSTVNGFSSMARIGFCLSRTADSHR